MLLIAGGTFQVYFLSAHIMAEGSFLGSYTNRSATSRRIET